MTLIVVLVAVIVLAAAVFYTVVREKSADPKKVVRLSELPINPPPERPAA